MFCIDHYEYNIQIVGIIWEGSDGVSGNLNA